LLSVSQLRNEVLPFFRRSVVKMLLCGLCRVFDGMFLMSMSDVSMMSSGFVFTFAMMLCSLCMMFCGFCVMLCGLCVMLDGWMCRCHSGLL